MGNQPYSPWPLYDCCWFRLAAACRSASILLDFDCDTSKLNAAKQRSGFCLAKQIRRCLQIFEVISAPHSCRRTLIAGRSCKFVKVFEFHLTCSGPLRPHFLIPSSPLSAMDRLLRLVPRWPRVLTLDAWMPAPLLEQRGVEYAAYFDFQAAPTWIHVALVSTHHRREQCTYEYECKC